MPASIVANTANSRSRIRRANFEIQLDANEGPLVPVFPRDPQFEDQWALANSGQKGGKQGADISATLAWAKTTGSDKCRSAVLDTGVDYSHEDLAANMWIRPDNLPPYHDNELGTIDDEMVQRDRHSADPMDDNGPRHSLRGHHRRRR
jgi:hypothetical protein